MIKSNINIMRILHYLIMWIFYMYLVFSIFCPMFKGSEEIDKYLDTMKKNFTRDVKVYLHPDKNTSIISSNVCPINGTHPYLLVIVTSDVKNLLRRIAVRRTWAKFQNDDVRVAFLLGTTNNSKIQSKVERESKRSNDIIQEDFVDKYSNLTLKSFAMLKWTLMNCHSIKFLMKADDDTFVNIPELLSLLRHIKRKKNLLLGSKIIKARPERRISEKYYIPKSIYRGAVLPTYASGSGYIMSYDVIPKLYKQALKNPLLHVEDAFITGICARKARILVRNHVGFNYLRIEPHQFGRNITSHYNKPRDFYSLMRNVVWSINNTKET